MNDRQQKNIVIILAIVLKLAIIAGTIALVLFALPAFYLMGIGLLGLLLAVAGELW